jgi:hypothetical protein
VDSNLTTVTILVSLLHVVALAVMIWIRVHRTEADAAPGKSVSRTPCTVCGDPATHWSYDGLDPNERHHRHTGQSYSTDVAYYHPLCAAH